VMLLLAVLRRIQEYGVTENRYIVVALGIWLAGMVVLFLSRKKGAITIVPASLALLACFSAFGPWSAFAVSERNQTARLQELLTRNRILLDGRIRPVTQQPPFEDAQEICSVLRYLSRVHGTSGLQSWFGRDFDLPGDSIGSTSRGQQPRMLASLMGVRYVEEWQAAQGSEFSFFRERTGALPVSGFDVLVRGLFVSGETSAARDTFSAGGMSYRIRLIQDSGLVVVQRLMPDSASVRLDLNPVLFARNERPATPDELSGKSPLRALGMGGGMNLMLVIERAQGKRVSTGCTLRYLRADLLLSDTSWHRTAFPW